jgi:dimethylhistidine N-methyltransferase
MKTLEHAPETLDFRRQVLRGLRRTPKELPCKFFYDERGSRLFDAICDLEEYYLTRTELAIMRRHAADMADRLGPDCLLVEYGSGSSVKTRLLLDRLRRPAGYVPVDISREHLLRSASALAASYPGLQVLPVCADFTADFTLPHPARPPARRVAYFPGSTIGNFRPTAAVKLLQRMAAQVGPGGGLLIGYDLRKSRTVLEPAYDDRAGVTRDFNLNLLARINRELGGDFDLARFRHRAFYNGRFGRVEMHLVSDREQTVHVGGVEFHFAEGESVRTECSYKYTAAGFGRLAARAGFRAAVAWTDERHWFCVQYLEC